VIGDRVGAEGTDHAPRITSPGLTRSTRAAQTPNFPPYAMFDNTGAPGEQDFGGFLVEFAALALPVCDINIESTSHVESAA